VIKVPFSIVYLSKPASVYSSADCYVLAQERGEKGSIVVLNNTTGKPHRIEELKTPWILFLKENEFLLPDERHKLSLVLNNSVKLGEVTVENFLSPKTLKDFAWVTTGDTFFYPSRNERRYYTAEIRVVSLSILPQLLFQFPKGQGETKDIIIEQKIGKNNVISLPVVISCIEKKRKVRKKEGNPRDREIFLFGHAKYFNDEVFSPRFAWPHSVYHTIRKDHIPSIIEALREGLSNPEIVLFTLKYLLRFREFSLASEIVKLIPPHWYRRNPALLNICATIHFLEGKGDRALQMLEEALKIHRDAAWLFQNAVKISVLLNRYEKAQEIAKKYRDNTGKELSDDYFTHFLAVHEGIPERTATVSLCLIVKDEESTIERAINSARQMADEIIVVDTGSEDKTKEIAEHLGARIFSFPWRDDFSAARNFAIEQATGDYIFMLDGDEYLSPFYYIESLTFKKLLSPKKLRAYKFSIGSYFNDTDWLFLVSERGNFRAETSAVRLFPRHGEIRYRGLIGETLEESLLKAGVPLYSIPDETLHILHEPESRRERLTRKCYLYKKVEHPTETLIITAISDFARLGDQRETLSWLRRYYTLEKTTTDKVNLGLKLARLSETVDPIKAEELYMDLLTRNPQNPSLILAYGEYLLTHHKQKKIREIPLEGNYGIDDGTQKMELSCFKSLKLFEEERYDESFKLLSSVLEENDHHPFAQALRFYYLIKMGDLEGALSSFDILFSALHRPKHAVLNSLREFASLAYELCQLLNQKGFRKESALILEGILSLNSEGKNEVSAI